MHLLRRGWVAAPLMYLASAAEHVLRIWDVRPKLTWRHRPSHQRLGVCRTVSHHLKKLFDAGLLEREQRGKWAYFSLKRDAVEKLAAVADLKGVCC